MAVNELDSHELTKTMVAPLPPYHQWCICAVAGINTQMSPPTYMTWNQTDWTCGDNATWPRSFWIMGHPMNASYPATSVGQNQAFYDLVCASVGQTQLTNGQEIVLDATATGGAMCNWGFVKAVDKMCVVYRGYFSQVSQIQHHVGFPGFNQAGGYQIYKGPCCSGSFPNTSVKTSWDCAMIGDHPKFGYQCIQIQGSTGQYLTKAECLQSGCEGLSPDPADPSGNIPGPNLPLPISSITDNTENNNQQNY
jgi:hypothetical protein|tara:strand:- start:18535 stop:19287 length:753 start_codon:yes stop_codon:yes gene_type:complete